MHTRSKFAKLPPWVYGQMGLTPVIPACEGSVVLFRNNASMMWCRNTNRPV